MWTSKLLQWRPRVIRGSKVGVQQMGGKVWLKGLGTGHNKGPWKLKEEEKILSERK